LEFKNTLLNHSLEVEVKKKKTKPEVEVTGEI
jgi:hypothetical protein